MITKKRSTPLSGIQDHVRVDIAVPRRSPRCFGAALDMLQRAQHAVPLRFCAEAFPIIISKGGRTGTEAVATIVSKGGRKRRQGLCTYYLH
jgi:hypothetical protein